jgi:hypothetical protein
MNKNKNYYQPAMPPIFMWRLRIQRFQINRVNIKKDRYRKSLPRRS